MRNNIIVVLITKTMMTFIQLIVLFGMMSWCHGFRMIWAPPGSCMTQRAYVAAINIEKYQCDLMGGTVNGNPGQDQWTVCYMDMCDIPSSGRVAMSFIWGVDPDQESNDKSDTRVYGSIRTIREECDALNGFYTGNPSLGDDVHCQLYIKRMDAIDRQNLESLIFCGKDECSGKIARLVVNTIHRECFLFGGEWYEEYEDAGANTWVNCLVDVARSPVLECIPQDSWNEIPACRNSNPDIYKVDCSFTYETGFKRKEKETQSEGGSTEFSVSAQVGAELKGIFTASVSTTFTTGFSWSTSVANTHVWSKSETHTFSMSIPYGNSMRIFQAVGECGDYRVATPAFKFM